MSPAYVNTREAAKYLGLHADTLRKLRREGGGPPYARIGRAVRYDLRELDRFMAERSYASTAEEVSRAS